MKIFNLPDDIPSTNKTDLLLFHNYTATSGTFNGRSILNKNAISLVVRGKKNMHFAEKNIHINEDEFHFLSTGNCLVSMKLAENTQLQSILIFFDHSVLTNFFLKYNHKITPLKNKQNTHPEPYLAFKKDDFVLNFMASLTLLLNNTSTFTTEMKQLKFEELMLHLLERYPRQILSFQAIKNQNFDDLEIRKVVETNLTTGLKLEDLAFLCNTSLSTFKRRFEKIYHQPPNKWILQKRMELAKDLLQHHKVKPGEVYHQVGYENHSSFSQSFKQTFGLTPSEFQQQQLNEKQQVLTEKP